MESHRWSVLALASLLCSSSFLAALVIPVGAKSPVDQTQLTPGQTHLLQRVEVSKIPAATAPNSTTPRVMNLPDDGAAVEDQKEASEQPGFVPLGEGLKTIASPTTEGHPSIVSNFSLGGVQGNGANPCLCSPPDPNVAAGPSHVFEVVNLAGVIYFKSGLVAKSTFALSSFFGVPTSSMSDPQVLYDSMSGRWFASVLDIPGDKVLFAVSDDSDPTHSWSIYALATAGPYIPDQPYIGVSDDKLVISANDYACCWAFIGNQYWVFSKSELVSGAATVHFAASAIDSAMFSTQPARHLSNSSGVLYMVTIGTGASGTAKMLAVTGVPPGVVTVTTFTLSTAPAGVPPDAGQPGGGFPLATNDNRVQSAVWNSNSLWFSLADACIPVGDSVTRSCLRLVQLLTAGTSAPTKLQDFDYAQNGTYMFYPAVSLDSSNDLIVAFGESSSTLYPSLAVTSRLSTDANNTLRNSTIIALGSARDNTLRYGDYFGAATDPSVPSTFWVAGEYRIDSTYPNWSTEIARVVLLDTNGSTSTTAACTTTRLELDESTTCTATVLGSAPAGNVSWSHTGPGGLALSSTICTLSSGQCSINVTGTSGGLATLNAAYAGDLDNLKSSSNIALRVSQCFQKVSASGPDSYESVVILACPSFVAGTYYVTADSPAPGPDISVGAYVFPSGDNYTTDSDYATSFGGNASLTAPSGYTYYVYGAGEGDCGLTSASYSVDSTNPIAPRFSSVGHSSSNSAGVSASCGASIIGGIGVKNSNSTPLSPVVRATSGDGFHDFSNSVILGVSVAANGSFLIIVASFGWYGIYYGSVDIAPSRDFAATVSLDPPYGSRGESIGVSGSALVPSASLSLTYDGSASGMPTGCTTDAYGIVTPGCAFNVPSRISGPHNVTVSDGNSTFTERFIDFTVLLDCFPSAVVGTPVDCFAFVFGDSPTGRVSFSSSGPGKFSRMSCKLQDSFCTFRFTPTSSTSPLTITGSYGGDLFNDPYSGTFSLSVSLRASTTKVTCSPKAVVAGSTSLIRCVAKVKGYMPTGNVTWSAEGAGSISFTSTTCTLTRGVCSVTMTGVTSGVVSVQASYQGDSNNLGSDGFKGIKVVAGKTKTTITCDSVPFSVGANITCSATVSGGHAPNGTITWSKYSGKGWVNFSSTTCPLVVGTCSVTIAAVAPGGVKIRATYGGDLANKGSYGNFLWK
ncbi:MAG: hypothetical protein HY297_01405 [Thaumarchaeota archaeon]|nr:hypothetical protein [Nitrososphaerota archaeon]